MADRTYAIVKAELDIAEGQLSLALEKARQLKEELNDLTSSKYIIPTDDGGYRYCSYNEHRQAVRDNGGNWIKSYRYSEFDDGIAIWTQFHFSDSRAPNPYYLTRTGTSSDWIKTESATLQEAMRKHEQWCHGKTVVKGWSPDN